MPGGWYGGWAYDPITENLERLRTFIIKACKKRIRFYRDLGAVPNGQKTHLIDIGLFYRNRLSNKSNTQMPEIIEFTIIGCKISDHSANIFNATYLIMFSSI